MAAIVAALAVLFSVGSVTTAEARRGQATTAAGCAATSAMPTQASIATAEGAILCLLNEQRTQRGLRKLHSSSKLAAAARYHSTDMVERDYFDHQRRGGPDLVQRVRRSGYLRAARYWSVGENIAWGTGEFATPRALVKAWMSSKGHRENILDRSFREIGVGIAIGTPSKSWDSEQAATATTDFGKRF